MRTNFRPLRNHVTNLLMGALLCTALAGCAPIIQSGLDQDDIYVDVSQQSLALMTLSLFHPGTVLSRPSITAIDVAEKGADGKSTVSLYYPDEEGQIDKNGRLTYILRMALNPGTYQIVSIPGLVGTPLMFGSFRAPLLEDFTVPAHSILYLGHVEIVLRPKQPGEFSAGPTMPFFAQRALGVSTGTFDVTVSDQSAEDLPLLDADFPALKNQKIVTAILPPWNRDAAAAWRRKNEPF